MKRMQLISNAIITFSLVTTGLKAQEALTATGGNTSGIGSVSYSVGQIVYTTATSANGTVTQGVQQAYIIEDGTGLEEAKGINLSVSAYPNPTSDYLTLSIDDNVQTRHALSQLSYQLYDMNGKLLQNEKITGNQTSIVMGNLVPAIYFIKVMQEKKEIKSFKIIITQ